MAKTCNNCQQQFDWKKPYDGTKLNLDGSAHNCNGQKSGGKGGGYYKLPITEATKILDTALTLCETILKRIDGTVAPGDQLVLTESIFKTLSSSYKVE